MLKTYITLTDFWHKRVLVPANSLIELTEAEVKYLRHAVSLVVDEAKKVSKAPAEAVEEVKAVVEKAADKPVAK